VGAGGALGCTQQLINRAYAEKGQDPSIRFGELIQAEREKRLSTLDAEAAEMQTRVEDVERQYDERKRREAEGAVPTPAPVQP